MEPITEVLRLLCRQAEIRNNLRRGHGSRVTEERELYLIRNQLALVPAVVQAITLAAAELDRPVERLSVRDIGKRY